MEDSRPAVVKQTVER